MEKQELSKSMAATARGRTVGRCYQGVRAEEGALYAPCLAAAAEPTGGRSLQSTAATEPARYFLEGAEVPV